MKTYCTLKSIIVPLVLAAAVPSVTRADFNPVALTPGSYTFNIVVSSNYSVVPYAFNPPGIYSGGTVNSPYSIDGFVGTGTNFTDNTYYEQGMYSRPGDTGYNSGVPVHGTVFTNINNANMTFVMPPTYMTNDDLMIVNDTADNRGVIQNGTFTFLTPTTASSLAILDAGGNGGCQVSYTVSHQSGPADMGSITVPDWFDGSPGAPTSVAWGCNGRMDAGGDYNNLDTGPVNNDVPYLDATTISVSSASPITSITLNWSSGSGVDNFFAVSASTDGTTYTPVAVSGFNRKTLIPASTPFPVTATMDNGTNIAAPGNTWFQQGYYSNNLAYGLPPGGTTINSQSQPTHHYQLSSYTNNAILIDTNHQSANIVPAAPTPYYGFAFLTAGGDIGTGNKMTNVCILQHQDGVNETNLFYGYDWFEQTVPNAVAFEANGRVDMDNRTLNNLGNQGLPYLFETYFFLNDPGSPVTNIVVQYKTAPGANATTYIMAVSATTSPIAPIITQQPQPTNQVWYAGQTATISVLAAGSPPLTNTWLVENGGAYVPLTDGTDANGSVVSGSATMTLTISNLTLADATNYEYVASNGGGSVTSSVASITIRTGIAGVVPISGWNNIANTTFPAGNSTNILSGDGSTSATLTLSGSSTNGWNSGITGDGANRSLMDGYLDAGNGGNGSSGGPEGSATVTIGGLTGSSYNVYIYCFPDQTRPSSATDGLPNYSVNGTIYYVPLLGGTGASTYDATSQSIGGTGFNGFIPGTTTNVNDFSQDVLVSAFGNYIEIANVAPVGGQITIGPEADTTSYRSPLNGIELVDTSAGGKMFGIHFLGNTGERVSSSAVPPIIDAQFPTSSFTVLTNHVVQTTFSVTVDGSSTTPLFYQWYRVSSGNITNAIPNGTGPTYVNVDTNNETLFCIVSNVVGTAVSTPVTITIVQPPPPTPYESTVLSYHPLSYWPLNETSGNIAYDYTGTNDGVYNGNYQLGQAGLPPTAGIGANTSVYFDGSTAYVNIPNSGGTGQLNITGPITVMAWVKVPTVGGTGIGNVLGHSDQSYRLTVFNTGAGNPAEPRFDDPGPDIYDSSLSINDGNWHLMVGVYDGTTEYLYVDGELVASSPATGVPISNVNDLLIGAAPDYLGARNFEGNIAQVSVYGYALTATQIDNIYASLDTAPQVSITPVSPSIYSGDSVTLTANVSGTAATSFQWYYIDTSLNSNDIAGATGSTYTIADAPPSYNGYTFGVIAANAYGTNTASTTLTVSTAAATLAPNSNLYPASGEAYVGAPVTYTINAVGSLPINYQWTVNGTNVNGATNASFTLAAPCGTSTIQVSFTNAYSGGVPVTSSQVTLQGDANPTNITFNAVSSWIGQGNGAGNVPTLVNGVLTLTDNNGGEASSAFYQTAQYAGSFSATFTYTAGGNMAADGTCFILQNSPSGPSALGGGGGALGYANPPITNSVALEINLYSVVGIAFGVNGATYGNGGGSIYGPTGNIYVNSGHPINFELNYANGVLAVNMTDETTLATYATNYTVGSLTPILGSSLAYVGFSGGDGGATSTQTITNFEFNSVIAPVALTATHGTNGTVEISWPATDPNYVLEMSSSLSSPSWVAGPTPTVVNGVNQVTVTPSGTEFYRLLRVVCQ